MSFLVLEYLEGQTLAERLRHAPLRIAEAVEVALQIVQALREAHRHGIVHRDLKPANVMLIDEFQAAAAPDPIDQNHAVLVKLLDFGLAKAATESPVGTAGSSLAQTQAAVTREGSILGTFSTWRRSSSRDPRPLLRPISGRSAVSSTRC